MEGVATGVIAFGRMVAAGHWAADAASPPCGKLTRFCPTGTR